MKKVITIALFFSICTQVLSQSTFQVNYGGIDSDDGSNIGLINGNEYIITGNTQSFGAGDKDKLILKIDSIGNVIWSITYGTAVRNGGGNLCITRSGEILIAGSTLNSGIAVDDWNLLKLDDSGNLIWEKFFGRGGSYDDQLYYVTETSDSNYIWAGSADGAGFAKGLIIKTNTIGDTLWTKKYIYPNSQLFVRYVKELSDGNLICTGDLYKGSLRYTYLFEISSSGDFLSGKFYSDVIQSGCRLFLTEDNGFLIQTSTTTLGAGGKDIMIIKLDSIGNIEWTKTYGGINDDEATLSFRDSDGAYVLSGYTESYGVGMRDALIFKIDSIGNVLWSKPYGGDSIDNANTIIEAADGGLIFCGTSNSFSDLGDNDIYIVKTDVNGNLEGGCNSQSINLQVNNVSILDSIGQVLTSSYNRFASHTTTISSQTISPVFQQLPNVNLGIDKVGCFGDTIILMDTISNVNYLWNDNSVDSTLEVESSGNYSITVTDKSNGCMDSDSIIITINPLPVVNLGGDTSICSGDLFSLDAENPGSSYQWSPNGDTSQSISVNASGLYSVTVTDSNFCSDFDSLSILINPVPTAEAGLNDYICEGDSITLSAGGGDYYAWSNGSNTSTMTVAPLSTTNYVVTVTDTNNCSDSDSVMVFVSIVVQTTISGLDSVYCYNDHPVTLVGEPAGGTFSGPVIGNLFVPKESVIGVNTITYDISDSCFTSKEVTVIVIDCDTTVGIRSLSLEKQLSIYPNPFTETTKITFHNPNQYPYTLFIYDLSGKMVYIKTNITKEQVYLHRDMLNNGLYFIKLVGETVNQARIMVD